MATLIYDGTVLFCNRFIDRKSRTHDQMVQAARSGRQNIAEGNRAGATSSKSEIHLTNVARGSLEELLLDFEDYLRQRKLELWSKQTLQAQKVRKLGQFIGSSHSDHSADSLLKAPTDAGARARAELYAPWLEHPEAMVSANTLICLIHQANYLLDRQLLELEKRFVEEGGFSETLAAARIAQRQEARNSRPKRQQPRKTRTFRSVLAVEPS